MITKTEAKGVVIDWDMINAITEVKRTYLVKDQTGREFYKMYKPSEVPKIFKENNWTGQIVSILNRSKK